MTTPAFLGPAGRAPLVGRGREQAVIAERLCTLLRGPAGVIMLAGEPGIGKTRLLDEAAAEAASLGVTVLRGGASEAEGMPPYLPFLEALGRYIRSAPPQRLQHEAGPWTGILASILPELALRLGDLPATPPLPAEQARLRLFEAVAEFLAAIAEQSPLLLVLDDLQWADRAGLELLSHVARVLNGTRIAVLGAYRAGEL
ncbi:MAG TPA: ATP-binding protein, partial [Dehalococcoidia bacterium]